VNPTCAWMWCGGRSREGVSLLQTHFVSRALKLYLQRGYKREGVREISSESVRGHARLGSVLFPEYAVCFCLQEPFENLVLALSGQSCHPPDQLQSGGRGVNRAQLFHGIHIDLWRRCKLAEKYTREDLHKCSVGREWGLNGLKRDILFLPGMNLLAVRTSRPHIAEP
jgi:hypothetical protein